MLDERHNLSCHHRLLWGVLCLTWIGLLETGRLSVPKRFMGHPTGIP